MSDALRVFFIADIVGEPGLQLIETIFLSLQKKYSPDFVIANAENSHEGRGINQEIVKRLYAAGIDVITGGNHSFDKWKIFSYMNSDPSLLRPFNYPKGNAGFGYGVYPVQGSDLKIGVLNLQGRTFMHQIDDPFAASDRALKKIREGTHIIFVDFHAEATADIMVYEWYFVGCIFSIIGINSSEH